MIYHDKIFGLTEITEPVIVDLIRSKIFQRLKKLYNHSMSFFIWPEGNELTRYEHSIGVYLILRMMGADIKEQIAGLLHDVSHTAFSHVADFAFGDPRQQTYQDSIHRTIVSKSKIPEILKKYNYRVSDILDEKKLTLLDRPLPNLCADRVDYFLRVALNYGELESGNIKELLSSLRVYQGKMVLDDKSIARWIARKFMWANEHIWASPESIFVCHMMGQAIKIAFQKREISEEDLFLTDARFLKKLKAINDPEVQEKLSLLKPDLKIKRTKKGYDFRGFYKVRYLDPELLIDNRIVRLSVIDKSFKNRLNNFLKKNTGECYLKVAKCG